jgi:hypothetical protein
MIDMRGTNRARRPLPVTRQQAPGHTSVDCLGFALRWGRDRAGKSPRTRRTSRKQRQNALKQVTDWCKEKCRDRRKSWVGELTAQWRGYSQSYGVNGNSASRRKFCPGAGTPHAGI